MTQLDPGYEAEQKMSLDQEVDRDLLLDATPAERLAMVWPLTQSCWAFVPGGQATYESNFQRHVVRVIRGGHEE